MEGSSSGSKGIPSIQQRLFMAAVPMGVIAVGYVDPGKWIAIIDGGARFGYDCVVPMLVFNLTAVLSQYLSARIGLVTGRSLAQVCTDEYEKWTCLFLGFQAELSAMAVDMAMIMGVSHGFSLLFGVNLLVSMLLIATGSTFFLLIFQILDERVVKLLCIILGGVVVSFVSGMLVNEGELPYSLNWIPVKLSGENVFSLMSLLGASVAPHNFYLHSYLVQHHHGVPNVSKGALCHDNLFAIVCIFSAIFLVNCSLVHLAANVFYSSGLIGLTFQDLLSPIDQVFRSPVVHFIFLSFLFTCNQITTSSWNHGSRDISGVLFQKEITSHLLRVAIRMATFIPAFYYAWSLGAEGILQLLMFLQIMVAMLLPASVIPLLRITSSRFIMGPQKISPHWEFFSFLMFVGMISLKIMFLAEMFFGSSEWAGNLSWNTGATMSVTYISILVIACTSLCLTIWLAATPLKSERVDSDGWKWNTESNLLIPSNEGKIDVHGHSYREVEQVQKKYHQSELIGVKGEGPRLISIEENSSSFTLHPSSEYLLTAIDENSSSFTPHTSSEHHEDETNLSELADISELIDEAPIEKESNESTEISSSGVLVEKTVEMEVKDNDCLPIPEPESCKFVLDGAPTSLPESPESFAIRSAKNDEVGSGGGSLSRLSGLGRAARRQLAAILDEFWGQLFDYHGQTTQEAKVKRLDVLLRSDSELAVTTRMEPPLSRSEYSTPGSSSFFQERSPSSWSNRMKLLDAYVQNSTRNGLNFSERNYSSLHLPPSSEILDYKSPVVQPQGNIQLSRNMTLQAEKAYDLFPLDGSANTGSAVNSKKYHSMPDISGLSRRGLRGSDNLRPWDTQTYNHVSPSFGENRIAFEDSNPSKILTDSFGTGSMWVMQPFEKYGISNRARNIDEPNGVGKKSGFVVGSEAKFLESFRFCIVKLLRLEGSDWLFRQNDGSDEDLIGRVAAKERPRFEALHRESSQQDRISSSLKSEDAMLNGLLDSGIPRCAVDCVWRMDAIVSFGVWCIHRILELSLMESRPELWGKYTYVLNRLQGIIDLAFSKPRRPRLWCSCVKNSDATQLWPSPVSSNLPPTAKVGRGKCTTASTLLELINDVEIAISCRKGRQGTAAGDVAFPKGRENLASVLKRYKRRLSGKQVGGNGVNTPSQRSAAAIGVLNFGHN